MDAVEYEKYRIKMCKETILKKGGCTACEMYDLVRQRCRTPASVCMKEDEDYYKKNVAIVEQWAKEHPTKTRQSELLKMFPKVPMKDDVIDICPATVVKGLQNAEHCNHILCEDCRKTFWLMEVADND